ncbi:MAG: uridine monophosphate kinase [Candidatus Bipolaricaulota bacterium]|nr:uridine monophosphate kinase [Candidatus Bipolaricaulota bacterium]
MKPRYRRVVVKLSGEVLAGDEGPLGAGGLQLYAEELRRAREAGAELGVVVGGGNIARGAALAHLPPVAGHTIGMLATVLNALALREVLAQGGVPSLLQSALPVPGVADPLDPWGARAALDRGEVVLFAGGTGNPFVTTDTAAVVRALAVGAEAVLKGSKVDGVYEDDPARHPAARLLPRLTPEEYLARGLRVLDRTAVTLAGEHRLPIVVFNATRPGALLAALRGETGSLIAAK